jgi:hypothetical protein
VKICQCRPEIRDCANENELCHCPGGRVRYGMGTKWTDWVMLESEDKVLCSNAEFGDPHSGKKKICQCEESLPVRCRCLVFRPIPTPLFARRLSPSQCGAYLRPSINSPACSQCFGDVCVLHPAGAGNRESKRVGARRRHYR